MKNTILTKTKFQDKYEYKLLTPIMQQYLDLKFEHQDCLLLFRLGDFYELFFEDAKLASSLLNLILTTRDKNSKNQIPMCGMPFHSVQPYITKLVNEGYKVALCEQTESPLEAKKRSSKALVNREVKNILTPATIIDETLIDTCRPNYLATLTFDLKKDQCCICFLDLGARQIGVFCIPIQQCAYELENLHPKEILISTTHMENKNVAAILKNFSNNIVVQADSMFALSKTKKILQDFYKINTCSSIKQNISEVQIQAIGVTIEYMLITQKNHIDLPIPKIINMSDFMSLEGSSNKNLEITQASQPGSVTLFNTLNYTKSHAGSRLLHQYLTKPLVKKQKIEARLQCTDFFYCNITLTHKIQKLIKSAGDIERSFSKISVQKASIMDFFCIKNTLDAADEIKTILMQHIHQMPHLLLECIKKIPNELEIKFEIQKAFNAENVSISITEGGFVNPAYHPKLKILSQQIKNLHHVQTELMNKYKKITQLESLKIQTNNVLGTFIEIPISKSNKLNDSIFIHKQTTVNTARFVTSELEDNTQQISYLKQQYLSLEKAILEEITTKVLSYSTHIHNAAKNLAKIDVFCSFASAALENKYVKPELHEGTTTEIYQGRHPVIEKSLEKIAMHFTANDCIFSQGTDFITLTGPNMGGKSTFLRQNAIIILMAHTGSFVPASKAVISITDKIFTRIGAGDNLSKGHSTFMLEMIETAGILSQATNKSFIILDEVGRGTSTYDGISIAWACARHIATAIKSKCIFATHYHEITQLSQELNNVKNYTVAAEEKDNKVLFHYRIEPGIANQSYGINVAKIAGLPDSVIQQAQTILDGIKKTNKI